MPYFKSKMHQIRFQLGLCSRTSWGAYSAPSDSLAGFKGPTSKGGEGKGNEGRPVFSVQFAGNPIVLTFQYLQASLLLHRFIFIMSGSMSSTRLHERNEVDGLWLSAFDCGELFRRTVLQILSLYEFIHIINR